MIDADDDATCLDLPLPSSAGGTVDRGSEESLDAALSEQRSDWLAGRRTSAIEWLERHPALAADPSRAAAVVYNEFVLSQELGECPDWDKYLRQFPQYAALLRLLCQADQFVEQTLILGEPVRQLPRRFGEYDLLEEVGRGGMGVVFKARQRSLDRIVALKIIRAGEGSSDGDRERFRQEALTLARLQHPNIVQIYDWGVAGEQHFLSLEFVVGSSLADSLDGTPWSSRSAATLLQVLAQAVDFAHSQGVVHRDLKPSNVLLTGTPETAPEQRPAKLADFGLAKRLDLNGETRTGAVLGTPSYMAPEQAEGRPGAVGPRTDVYGLGAILYELLTGRPPFRAESPLLTLKAVTSAEPVRPRLLNPGVPRDLETICLKCLQKEPSGRYASAGLLADDLRRFLHGEPVLARREGAFRRSWRWCRRNPAIVGLSGSLVFAIVGSLLAAFLLWAKSANNEARAVAVETQGRTYLEKEVIARREADEHYTLLRDMLTQEISCPTERTFLVQGVTSGRKRLLEQSVPLLHSLRHRHEMDRKMCELLATALTQLGAIRVMESRDAEAQLFLEQAAVLWEPSPLGKPRTPENLSWRAITHIWLMQLYERQRCPDRAQESFETVFNAWQGLADEPLDPVNPLVLVNVDLEIGWALVMGGEPRQEASERFANLQDRLGRVANAADSQLFFDIVRVGYWHGEMDKPGPFRNPAVLVANTRTAASSLKGWLARTDLPRNRRSRVACIALRVSKDLRRENADEEALQLAEQADRALQDLLVNAPDDRGLIDARSQAWSEIAKAHWELQHPIETVTACRNALEAERRVVAMSPGVTDCLTDLDWRYFQLGRKLCELGRLGEAEACFHERQTLWPEDIAKQGEVLHELQKWATQVGKDKDNLSQAEKQKRQCYLDLCARLERKP